MWFLADALYQAAAAVTVVLIGRALGSNELTICLFIGSLVWAHFSRLLEDIAHNITFERWEDTIEYTLGAPISRMAHLLGVALYGFLRATAQTTIVFLILMSIIAIPITFVTGLKIIVVIVASSLALYGLGIAVATFPLFSEEYGPQGAQIANGLILMISGVNYPISVLPGWIQYFSYLSPATYAIEACRKVAGVQFSAAGGLISQPNADLIQVLPEMGILLALGILYIPFGNWIFSKVEQVSLANGWLKRSG